ncbi:putative Mg2+ transporter-C (MgtC) family protein [Saliterribacillus persicus]|uniref:Putative Mg2+ transporter-C (MgtC) family protein n=2 Tax=Saliterribacillus persicus TaxID=930114 RepID=A0A368XC54_9BACI|nr:putative Mg2+ transporter-C (MgtC) family protein [Saliterribacillus persicus]
MISTIFDQQFMESISKILIALLLSGLIGFERELKNHSAGFRTHILVGVSACLMMLLSVNGFTSFMEDYDNVRFDPARIPSYVISGIGFLGAGTIIVNGMTIRGLTTAASIWAVAGLGLVVGIGMYKEAILTTFVILVSLVALNKIEKLMHKGKQQMIFELKVAPTWNMTTFMTEIHSFDLNIREIEFKQNYGISRNLIVHIDSIELKDKEKIYNWLADQKDIQKINFRM